MILCIYSGFVYLLLLLQSARAIQTSPATLASQYSLSTSTSLPFPTATLSSSNSQSLIVSEWSLSKGRIQDQASDLAFVTNPFPENSTSSSSPVLQVNYPEGSYSHNTGGSQFENLWNTTDGSSFQSMLLSYEVAFDENFDWVLGGKLPGLRGGTNVTGCSGGDEPTGLDCFSTRLMWRPNGVGEVYAYIPTTSSFCQEKDIICNSDFGVSISRGAFTFTAGEWNHVTLFVQMNSPVTTANGVLQLYLNDQQVISRQDLQYRRGSSVDINGFYFSTFFGGSDSTWATPVTTHTYYRNIQLWGSANPSNGTALNTAVNPALRTIQPINYLLILVSMFATTWSMLI